MLCFFRGIKFKIMNVAFRVWKPKHNRYDYLHRQNYLGGNGVYDQYIGCNDEDAVWQPYISFDDKNEKFIYVGDIVDVCVFRVSPSNPDDDYHYRGQIIFKDGMYQIKIFAFLYSNTDTLFIPITDKKSPFYNDDELLDDGTIEIPLFILCATSGNLGVYNEDNVEVIGNIYETPEILECRTA